MTRMPDQYCRYHRQMLLDGFGPEGQNRLGRSHAVIVGCGALGCVSADHLARSGVGRLTLVDRDIVEMTNLQRQILYTEADAAAGTPKAVAARDRLTQVNSSIEIEAVIADFNYRNAERLVNNADVIIDGLDNFETRFLINDLAVKLGIPYMYGGAVATTGMSLTVLPAPDPSATRPTPWAPGFVTPCLRCLFESAPPPGTSPTCDTVGVLAPIVSMVASVQAAEAIKVLLGHFHLVNRDLLWIDLWSNVTRSLKSSKSGRSPHCPCCVHRRFEHLAGDRSSLSSVLCGSNAVQIMPAEGSAGVSLAAIQERLAKVSYSIQMTPHLLRAEVRSGTRTYRLTVFEDGRAIIKGVVHPDEARSVYARYIGS